VKTKFIFFGALVFALALTFVAVNPTFACEPRSETDPRCEMPRPKPRVYVRVVPTATPAPAAPKPTAVAVSNRGSSPSDALPLDDKTWRTVGANSYLWFMDDNGTSFFQSIVLETKLANGVNFATFAPEQENALTNSSPPKGRGTLAPVDSGNPKYTWSSLNAGGRWFFLVTNYNPTPVEIKLASSMGSDDRSCVSEVRLGNDGKPFVHVDCGKYGYK